MNPEGRPQTGQQHNDVRITRVAHSFGALVGVQAVHSFEEYIGRLWESFPPARFLTGLVAPDHELGFIVINVTLVVFGIWCFAGPIRRGWPSGVWLAWAWVVIEIINGVGHPVWSLAQGGYTPGLLTALVLLPLALVLARRLHELERGSPPV